LKRPAGARRDAAAPVEDSPPPTRAASPRLPLFAVDTSF